MWELVCALPPRRRPRRILYPASGVHLAPLVLCEALPDGVPCRLDLTEVDATVAGPIGDLLSVLENGRVVRDLHRIQGDATEWRFRLSGHPVRLRLILRRAPPRGSPPLLTPQLLAGHQMVVSHDWAGDPVGNLRVVFWFLRAARALPREEVPMLMMENLEAHPFPVDLGLLGVLATTGEDYGHRVGPRGIGRHTSLELGEPIFGGGVLLGFHDPWWREVSEEDLEAVLDLLIFSRFGWGRRNVLAPGSPPRCAPALLDWWTGFGGRTVGGGAEPISVTLVRRMVRGATRAWAVMGPGPRDILCRHLRELALTLRRIAAAEPRERPDLVSVAPADLPPGARRQLEAARERRSLREREQPELRRRARAALRVLEESGVQRLLRTCAKMASPGSAGRSPAN